MSRSVARIIVLGLFILGMGSCQSDTKKEGTSSQASKEHTMAHSLGANNKELPVQSSTVVDIDYVKTNTKKASIDFTIPSWRDSLVTVPKEFLEKHLFDAPVSVGYDKHFPKDTPEFFRFYEYKDLNEYFVFTITYADESCCRTVYGVTVDKESKNVVDIGVLGLSGGDGGWGEEDSGTWKNDTLLHLLRVESYDEDFEDNEIVIDSVWVDIGINSQGKFSYQKLDSVHVVTTESIQ